MKKGVLLLGIVLAVVVAGWLLFGNGDNWIEEPIEIGDAIQPDFGEIDRPDTGIIQNANLVSVGDYTGSGIASSSYIDGIYSHSVSANIGDPAEGKFYEGWLAGGFGFISTGKMVKDGDKYVLEFTSNEDLTSKYSKVVITEETAAEGLDNMPEAHVIEGSWK